MLSESSQIPSKDEIMFSLFLRPISPHDVRLYALRDEIEHSKRFYLSPLRIGCKAQAENRLCRTIVRRRDAFRRFCIFFISPRFGSAEKRRSKKRIRAIIGLLFSTNTKKADEILSDFSEEMIIRLLYRLNPSLPYACTATRRVSTLLHLFYLSPFRVG